MFAGKKSAQIREILISESAWEEMTCLFAPSLVFEQIMVIRMQYATLVRTFFGLMYQTELFDRMNITFR